MADLEKYSAAKALARRIIERVNNEGKFIISPVGAYCRSGAEHGMASDFARLRLPLRSEENGNPLQGRTCLTI